MPNIVAAGSTGDKLFLISGVFTSTIKTSLIISSIDTSTQGMSTDGFDAFWVGNTTPKIFKTSGKFTTTIKSSVDFSLIDASLKTGTPNLAGDVIASGSGGDKLYLMSGQFTSTIKTSVSLGAVDSSVQGNSYDEINTLWVGGTADKLFLQSGAFTSTIKSSVNVSAIDSSTRDIGWDGTNTIWSGDSANKYYLQSGQFTSTLKTSISAPDSTPRGVEIESMALRSGLTTPAVGHSVAFGQTPVVENPIYLDPVVSSVAFNNTAADVAIFAALGNAILFDSAATSNIKVLTPSNTISYTSTGVKVIEASVSSSFLLDTANDDNFEQQAATNTISFSQDTNQRQGTASNDLLLDHILGLQTSIRSASVSNDILFLDVARNNIFELLVTHDIAFADTLARNIVANLAVESLFSVEQLAQKVVEGTAANAIALAGAAYRAGDPSNAILFSHTATGATNKSATNTVSFTQTVVVVATRSLAVSNTFACAQTLFGKLPTDCLLPTTTTISLAASGATTLVLKRPDLGNSEDLDVIRVIRKTRGNVTKSYRDPSWPEETVLTFEVAPITEAKKNLVLTFLQESLGKLITYTDQDNRIWECILDTPEEVAITEVGNCDNYRAEFSLRGVLQ